jgi:maltose alpha-D-glucosyltransferase/alpha-amylase
MDQTNPAGVSPDLHGGVNRQAIENALPEYIATRRWFGGKARTIRDVRIADSLAIGHGDTHRDHIAIVEVSYGDGDAQQFVLPIKLDLVQFSADAHPDTDGEIARWSVEKGTSQRTLVASDATLDVDFATGLLDAVSQDQGWSGERGDIVTSSTPELASLAPPDTDLTPSVLGA